MPYPVEPRTFGATHTYPREASAAAQRLNESTVCPVGPPCGSTMPGFAPSRFKLYGTHKNALMIFPSKLL